MNFYNCQPTACIYMILLTALYSHPYNIEIHCHAKLPINPRPAIISRRLCRSFRSSFLFCTKSPDILQPPDMQNFPDTFTHLHHKDGTDKDHSTCLQTGNIFLVCLPDNICHITFGTDLKLFQFLYHRGYIKTILHSDLSFTETCSPSSAAVLAVLSDRSVPVRSVILLLFELLEVLKDFFEFILSFPGTFSVHI